MPQKPGSQQFVLLPPRGIKSDVAAAAGDAAGAATLSSLHQHVGAKGTAGVFKLGAAPASKIRVLDSVAENGAKLVEMTPEAMNELKAQEPGMRVVPVVYYTPAVAPRHLVATKVKAAAGGAATTAIQIKVVSKADGTPVAGAMVVAFTDFANLVGAQGVTKQNGTVSLALGGSSKKIERLYVYPPSGYWGKLKKNFTLKAGAAFGLTPIDLSFQDCLRFFYAPSAAGAGQGVQVGVVDTGIALNHPDLSVVGGENTVQGENANDFGDNGGEGHGTHVAGIIAAKGTPPTGLRGVAPAARLFSYRVFGKGAESASNFAIAKALARAADAGCDVINMSLGGGPADEATRSGIEYARAHGALVIVAAGNENRSPVAFPASDSFALAVSALGRKGTFPSDSTESGDVAGPYGTDKKNFIAAFSNIGPEIDVTCTGVGVLSTVPTGYAPMSGTSMACPSVTGFAARLLSGMAGILGMPRNEARSDAIAQALLAAAKDMGFTPEYEGKGMPK
ncbi:MAG TPA: S8 family serine peptidase [Thermoanaerobaculia bacterium]|nr:S8 family serine peptidase [Thermoanaerobaculia bacterium]